MEGTRNNIIPENINFTVSGATLNFITKECPEEDSRISSGQNLAIRADSFGISRSTSIRFSDSLSCMTPKLSIGLDIKDRNENLPVSKSILETHLINIKNKNLEDAKFVVTYTEDCNIYQSSQRVFDDQSQLYWYSGNDEFDYEIDRFTVTDGSYCGYGVNFNLIELEGSFSGKLFTAEGAAPERSVEVDCQDFYIAILHEK